jgi:autotransporter-associated beta strand protein
MFLRLQSGLQALCRRPTAPSLRRRRPGIALLCGCLGFSAGPQSDAQTTVTWTGGSSQFPNRLDEGENWVGGAVPNSSQIALFNSATFPAGGIAPQSTNPSFAGIWVSSGAGALTFTGPGSGGAKTLSIGASGVVNDSANTFTFDISSKVNLSLTADASFTANGPIVITDSPSTAIRFNLNAFTLTLNGTSTSSSIAQEFGGTGSVVKLGSGTWTLSGNNVYTGTTTISQGTLSVGNIVVSNGSSHLGNATSAVILGGTSTTGVLSYTGNSATYTRGFTVNAGGGQVDTTTAGQTLTIATGNVATSGTFTIGGAGNTTINSTVSGTGGLAKTGTGTLTVAGTNTFSGTTTVSAGTLTVNSGAALSGSTAGLVVNAGTLNLNNTAQTISTLSGTGGTINLASGHTLTANQSSATSFAGTLAGAGTFVKSGGGNLTLSGNSTYTGTTTINAGTLTATLLANAGTASSLGAPATANATIRIGSGSTGGTLAYTGAAASTNRVVDLAGTTGGATLDASGTGALTFTSAFTATGAGAKTLTLTGTSTAANTIAGAIVDSSGATSVAKTGTGTWLLSGSNTYTGTTTISDGTLSASNIVVNSGSSNLGNASSAVILGDASTTGILSYTGSSANYTRGFTVNAGGGEVDVTTAGQVLLIESANVATSGTFTIGGSGDTTITSAVTGTGGLAKAGTGTLSIAGTNTFSGTTTVSAGNLTVNTGASLSGSTAGLVVNGGALNLNHTAQTIASLSGTGGTINLASGHTLTANQTANTTFAGTLAGAGNLTKSGTGTLTLSSASTRTGGTQIDAGTLRLGAPSALGNVSQTVTLNGGTLDLAIDSSVAAHPVSVAASSTISSNRATSGSGLTHTFGTLAIGTGTLSINAGANISTNSAYGVTFGATTLSGNATFDVANNGTATGTLTLGAVTPSGSGSLTKTGAGTLVFTGANTFGGGITLSAGRIVVDSGAFLASSSAPLTVSGGSLLLNNTSQTVASLQFSSGSLSGSLTLGGLGSAWTGGGSFSGSGTLTVANTANLAVSGTGDRDFNGYNIVNQGTVNWSGANLRAGGGSVFTNSGTINDTNTGAVGISLYPDTSNFSFANSGNYTKSGGAITTISIPFANTGNVTVTGTGSTLRFTGTYTQTAGSLSVGSGALARFDSNVTLAGAVTGAGTVQAPTVTVSGELRPGSSPGSLTINGNLTLAATSALLIEIGGTTQGTDYDFLSVTGNASLGGDLRVTLVNGFSSSINSGHNFTILTAGSAPSGSFANITNQRVSLFSGIGSFQVSFSGNSVVLSDFTPIPEPSTWALLGLGSALTLLSTLRRRSVLRVPRR